MPFTYQVFAHFTMPIKYQPNLDDNNLWTMDIVGSMYALHYLNVHKIFNLIMKLKIVCVSCFGLHEFANAITFLRNSNATECHCQWICDA